MSMTGGATVVGSDVAVIPPLLRREASTDRRTSARPEHAMPSLRHDRAPYLGEPASSFVLIRDRPLRERHLDGYADPGCSEAVTNLVAPAIDVPAVISSFHYGFDESGHDAWTHLPAYVACLIFVEYSCLLGIEEPPLVPVISNALLQFLVAHVLRTFLAQVSHRASLSRSLPLAPASGMMSDHTARWRDGQLRTGLTFAAGRGRSLTPPGRGRAVA